MMTKRKELSTEENYVEGIKFAFEGTMKEMLSKITKDTKNCDWRDVPNELILNINFNAIFIQSIIAASEIMHERKMGAFIDFDEMMKVYESFLDAATELFYKELNKIN